jgi:cell division protein FtsB
MRRSRTTTCWATQGQDEGDWRGAGHCDGWRCGPLRHCGRDGTFIQPNYIIALLFDYLVETRGWKNGVAKSVATTNLINALADYHKVPLYETPVGFKYIGELIIADKIAIGGEESAGLTIRGHVPEKDGVIAGLLVAEMVATRGKSLGVQLKELFGKVGSFYPVRENFRLTPEVKAAFTEKLKADPTELSGRKVDAGGAHRRAEADSGRRLVGLLPAFGTEPVVRAYTEARSEQDMEALRRRRRSLCCRRSGLRLNGGRKWTAIEEKQGRPGPAVPAGAMHRRRTWRSGRGVRRGPWWLWAGAAADVARDQRQAWPVSVAAEARRRPQLQREIKDLEQENAQLKQSIERLKSDPDAIEHEAREKLHYAAKPGEVIYTLPKCSRTPGLIAAEFALVEICQGAEGSRMAADAVSALAFGYHSPGVEEPAIARGAHNWPR